MAFPAIEASNLTKRYGRTEALRGLDLSVPRGSIFGFLGRNGAGKTTTLKIALGLAHRSSGEIRVLGLDPAGAREGVEIRRRSAFVSEEKDLYPGLMLGQILEIIRPLYPRWDRALEGRLLRMFGLSVRTRAGAASKGTRTRMALAAALPRGAELLVLDEPTDGLDPAMQEEVLQVLVGLAATGEVTIFFSTHRIAEVEQVADHVCVVESGRAALAGSLDDIRERYRRVDLVFEREDAAAGFAIDGAVRMRAEGRFLSLVARANVDAIVDRARALGATSVDVVPISLKEIFLDAVQAGQECSGRR